MPRRPRFTGWLSTDADEIERRRLRGAEEAFRIEAEGEGREFFGTWRVRSQGGQGYPVEIRSLEDLSNSCGCPDHRVNGLGTCKHIEATLNRLRRGRKRAFMRAAAGGSPYLEVYLDRRDQQVRLALPGTAGRPSRAQQLLAAFFSAEGVLAGDPLDALPALLRAVRAAPPAARRSIRVSEELQHWLHSLDRREQQRRARRHFEAEVEAGRASLDVIRHRLYAYQQEGMLHLAFTGRALLADEMGLGKTVQAVAACELLRRTQGIQRVLVVSPASLKGEWQEQIAKFTDLSSHIIQGPRASRLRQYEGKAFFHLANYEQILPDVAELNAILKPDVIILDEAQRIKNWQTKTASAVKRLQSPYAFVLTGTPVENRIDEIYSIVQFLDPAIFGPLFRFNRDFHQLDENGRATGYKNLDQLHARLRPVMLRRRKEEVEGQLPGRTVNTYFVPMHKEQQLRYDEYQAKVARLAAMAVQRPLKKEEMERLQRFLACMRMLCDTPYILDRDCRIAPKLEELDKILQELLEEGGHKIIIFSEWSRMLDLVRELAQERGIGHALHTGQVSQIRRREEIRRFKQDPACRLFLSTDSGSVGLNLQAADVVINLDLPWNPAKLEQRIARAWRKHQKRTVQVINLVTEHSIEQRMLALLEQKRGMAAGVVDGAGESAMRLPSGRAAFLERVGALLSGEPRAEGEERVEGTALTDPVTALRDDLATRRDLRVELAELHGEGEERTLLVAADAPDEGLRASLAGTLEARFPDRPPRLHLLDRRTLDAIEQLIEAGILQRTAAAANTLYRAPEEDRPERDARARRLAQARKRLADSERKRRMAQLLGEGGFAVEALGPLREAVETALQALAHWRGEKAEAPLPIAIIEAALVRTSLLPAGILSLVARLRGEPPGQDEAQASELLDSGQEFLRQAASLLG